MERILKRRDVVKAGSVAALSLCFPSLSMASARRIFIEPERRLSFYNIHTGETLTTAYYAMGSYLKGPLDDINYILRDHRTGEVKAIDRDLLDLLYDLSVNLDRKEPFHIISGYRSPESNAYLRTLSTKVAKQSLHLSGKAVDVRIPGCDLEALRKAATTMKCGGVGYYRNSNFVHLDVGPCRHWNG